MPIHIQPQGALNQAYRKQKVKKEAIDSFSTNLKLLLNRVEHSESHGESEENFKNHLTKFLLDTYYGDRYEINTYQKTDLVIHNDKSAKSTVGILLEVKRPANKPDMVTTENLNAKAFQELLLYYFRQKDQNNNDLKYGVITNIYEWFIIDAQDLFKYFYQDKALRKEYDAWKNGQKESNSTNYFYKNIAAPAIQAKQEFITCTYVNLHDYLKLLHQYEDKQSHKLTTLYKLFSPEHLLKQSFANDSNSLDKKFYHELLHIIGLSETKEKGKKLIQRKPEGERDAGSLLENTISVLEAENRLYRFREAVNHGSSRCGSSREEQLFNIALELTITWMNRILFLKLLEAQLINYHNSKEYAFLNQQKIRDFDDLNSLFFEVLAKETAKRTQDTCQYFGKVPYLNSSLFELTDLEGHTIVVSNLKNRFTLSPYKQTVLKEARGISMRGISMRGISMPDTRLSTLEYLFRFLDAYDFSAEGGEEIQEENKTLINASVLGLIFEKINGYKDGSFFTPGFITMYMCRETIRRAVVQKFREAHQKDFANFTELNNFADGQNYKTDFIRKSNELINSLTLCDPAVGSGHFLVSALNEIIAIKSDLGILADREGKTLPVRVEVVNDELIVTDRNNAFFKYVPGQPEAQRIQETLFHEKQNLIESCLFGVDINENSVKICRLRLWIELLKHAYYIQDTQYAYSSPVCYSNEREGIRPEFLEASVGELQTLPNIDINIKTGNSLLYRFDLKEDLSEVFKKQKFSLAIYKDAVKAYKSTYSKEAKRKLLQFIREIKEEFTTSISNRDPRREKLAKLRGQLVLLDNNIDLFGQPIKDPGLVVAEKRRLTLLIAQREQEIEDIQTNVIYQNAFEWRFEFPEVLDEKGEFIGFDIIIGNPPYIPLEELSDFERKYIKSIYPQLERKFETSVPFIIKGLKILNHKGLLSYIAPITWQTGNNYITFRESLFKDYSIERIVNLPFNIFEDAYVETALYFFSKTKSKFYEIFSFDKKAKAQDLNDLPFLNIDKELIITPDFKIILNPFVHKILKRLDKKRHASLGDITISTQGLSGSQFTKYTGEINNYIYPYLNQGNVHNYLLTIKDTYLTDLSNKKSLIQYYEAGEKILIRRIINRQDRLSVGYTDKRLVFKKDINPFIVSDSRFDTKYLLAVLASKLLSFFYLNISSIASKDDFRQTTLTELRNLPMPVIPLEEQKIFIEEANEILKKKSEDSNADTSALEAEIDQMVYALYGLTEEEIKIIENSLS